MKKILYIMGIAAVLASCSKVQDDAGSGIYDRVLIEFGSSIETTTRVPADDATQFTTGDKIGIVGTVADVAGKTTDFSSPFLNGIEFNYGGTKFTPTTANAAAYWQLGKVHNFYAYYPHDLTITAGGQRVAPTHTLRPIEGAATGTYPDIMWAKSENADKFTGTAGNIANLQFKHVLSLVKFYVKKEKSTDTNPILNDIEFTMAHDQGTLDLSTGVVNKFGDPVNLYVRSRNIPVTSTTAQDANALWRVLPHDAISDIYLTIGTQKLAATFPSGAITTVPGKITAITITIKPSGVEFTSSTLEDWNSSTEGEGEVSPPVAIGDYYYSDGTYSTAFSVPSGATLLGVVYQVNGNKGMLVAVKNADKAWSSSNAGSIITKANSMTDGQANMETIKALNPDLSDYPAFKQCADMNTGGVTGWYLPATNELHTLSTAYNTYGNDAFNALMTAPGVGGAAFGKSCLSSSEQSQNNADYVNLIRNSEGGQNKIYPNPMRCVKAF